MSFMYRNGQEVEVVYSGIVADVDSNIVVSGSHVCCYINCNRERSALPQNLHDVLQVHCTDETSIAADNTLRT